MDIKEWLMLNLYMSISQIRGRIMECKKQLIIVVLVLSLCVAICNGDGLLHVLAKNWDSHTPNPNLTTQSVVNIDKVFGQYQKTVDENLYYSLSMVNADTLKRIYGNKNTKMFEMAKETINPCMAFATTWGEAGSSYKGISLTTVMDFNPNTYVNEIDWITLSRRIDQVDSAWYYANTKKNYNTNENGKAWRMPVALLQHPRSGSRKTSEMAGLGVGPYQVTSPDWNAWDIDVRVNPLWGYEASLRKCGSNWITSGIDPISDITIYACLSLGHQGGNLITYNFGKELINHINTPRVQQAILDVGYQMYIDAREKAYNRSISLSDINVVPYLKLVESQTGINFSDYTGGAGRTNKGDYTMNHVLRYVFYKFYFSEGV